MYRLTSIPDVVERIADGATIPLSDADGAAQREYAEWLAAGNVPDPYVPPFDQAAALQRARDMRKPILDALVGIGLQAMYANDTATLSACLTARQGLLDITKDPDVLAATSDDAFDAVVLAKYHALVAGAPAAVVSAFQESAT